MSKDTFEVGSKWVIERHDAARVVHTRTSAVTKITPKRVYFGDCWFAIEDPRHEVKPRYLYYREYVVGKADSKGFLHVRPRLTTP